MAKSQKEQNLYNRLLVTQAINYQKLGYTDIKINNESCLNGQPGKICGYVPDLSAVLDDSTILCEAVTADSMNEPKMIERWKTFNRSGCEFHMIIPKAAFNEIKEYTMRNGIYVDKFWYSKYC